MLTNAYETQVVQSLGVRIGPAEASAEARRGGKCPFSGDDPGDEDAKPGAAGEPMPVRWTSAAEARLANIPEFVRPMAKTGIEKIRPWRRAPSKWTRRSWMRPATSSACDAT